MKEITGNGWKVTAWKCDCHPDETFRYHSSLSGSHITNGHHPQADDLNDLTSKHTGLRPWGVNDPRALLADYLSLTQEDRT